MAPIQSLLTLGLLALAAAAPATKGLVKRTAPFQIDQVASGLPMRSGPHAVLRTYLRHGVEVPQAVLKAAGAVNGTVPNSPDTNDAIYYMPVTIGGNQVLHISFDTGSADFWCFSSLMQPGQTTGHRFYDPSKSQSSKRLAGQTWRIQYGDGTTASGNGYTDTVSLGNGVAVQTQAIGLATTASDQFITDQNNDGIMGFGASSMNEMKPTPQKTFWDNVKAGLDQPIFSVDLRRGAPGSFFFGGIDTGKYSGPMYYTRVDKAAAKGLWQFTATGYGVGSGKLNTDSFDAIVDTGSSTTYLPDDAVTAYYAGIDGAHFAEEVAGWIFPCSASLPDLAIGVEGHAMVSPGRYMNYAPLQEGSSDCYGGVQPNPGTTFSIIGGTFLKAVYVAFNDTPGQPLLGFAHKPLDANAPVNTKPVKSGKASGGGSVTATPAGK